MGRVRTKEWRKWENEKGWKMKSSQARRDRSKRVDESLQELVALKSPITSQNGSRALLSLKEVLNERKILAMKIDSIDTRVASTMTATILTYRLSVCL